ncbi:hypothetical protein ACFSTD_10245 [Novosphingobium colocasiae]
MHTIKRRALVLTQEGAGHPFRRSLPSHVFTRPCDGEAPAEPVSRWKLSGADWRGFFFGLLPGVRGSEPVHRLSAPPVRRRP